MWISCNPTTCTRGRLSFSCDLTGVDDSVPFSKIKFVPFLDPNKRPGGLVSESYAIYHGWQVSPKTDLLTGHKVGVLCTGLRSFPQPLDA